MDIPTLNKCPGYNLYIGGVISLRRPKALKHCNITHIVSVLDWKFDDDSALIQDYQHLHIPVDDVEDENLLEWFPRSNAFIHGGLGPGTAQGSGDTASVANDLNPSGSEGGGVLIHCAMGKSRSATVLLAYLLWSSRQKHSPPTVSAHDPVDLDLNQILAKPLSVAKALMLLRRGRPIAEPNPGFMDQLHMYVDMGCPSTDSELKRHKIYRRWMNRRSVEESLRINQAPEMADIIFEDEPDSMPESVPIPPNMHGVSAQSADSQRGDHMQEVLPGISAPDGTLASAISPSKSISTSTAETEQLTTLKCRKCRHTLATTPFVMQHDPPPHRDPSRQYAALDAVPDRHASGTKSKSSGINNADQQHNQCAHVFLHPLSWMRSALAEGNMEGRLTCPNTRCGTNVGKFSWTGLRCNCGGWVTPGFGLIRGKIDEVMQGPTRTSVSSGRAQGRLNSGGGGGIRLPPGMVGRENL